MKIWIEKTMIKFADKLDQIIFERLMEILHRERSMKISLDVKDFVEDGYSIEEIENSLNRIAKIDVEEIFEEIESVSDMTMQ